MGYQIIIPKVASWVPNCSWAIPHPWGVSPDVCTLLGVTEPVLYPPKVWQFDKARPRVMGTG